MSVSRNRVYEPTKDLSGVRIGNDFWPEIVWQPAECRSKHEKIVPWGMSRSNYHRRRGWKQ